MTLLTEQEFLSLRKDENGLLTWSVGTANYIIVDRGDGTYSLLGEEAETLDVLEKRIYQSYIFHQQELDAIHESVLKGSLS